MGEVTFGAPRDFAVALRDEFDARCFVETGTNEGGTAAWAASEFDRVLTVEAALPIYERARLALSDHANVECHFGGSPAFLASIAHTLPRSLFWLDAHWCGPETAGSDAECPLLSELAAIMPVFHRHIVLIDDARFFLKPAPIEHNHAHWPSLDDIFRLVQSFAQTYSVVHADTILIVPAMYRLRVTDLLRRL